MLFPSIKKNAAESGSFLHDDVETFSGGSALREVARRSKPKAWLGRPPVLGPGARVDRFRLSARLGEGASGVVFAAYDELRRRDVALKILRSTDDPSQWQRFRREARLGAAVEHPNLVQVHEMIDTPGCSLIVMELLRGKTLSARMREAAAAFGLSREETLRIAGGVCRGLAAVHGAGIVHRDVKPANVMIGAASEVKLIDFGLATLGRAAAPAPAGAGGQPAPDLTERGMIIGTPRYMSPEQARGERLDPSTDVFSVGVMLYEMLTGAKPFTGRSPLEVLCAIQRDDPAPPSQRGPREDRVAPALDRLVLRCLEKNPRARYADAGDLLRDLLALSPRMELSRAA